MSSDHPSSVLKQLVLPLCVLLLVVSVLVGCNRQEGGKIFFGNAGSPKDVVTVFFSKYQGNRSIVEEVVRKLPPDAKGNPLAYALTELLKGPTPDEKKQGFYSEIPNGTKLLGVDQKRDALTINLSRQFAGGGGSNSMVQRLEELKQTVFSVDSRNQVNVSVEGEPLKVLGGEGLEVDASFKREAQ